MDVFRKNHAHFINGSARILLTLVFMVSMVAVKNVYGQPEKEVFSNILASYQSAGLVMNFDKYGKYYVNPNVWNNMINAVQKKEIAYQFACHNKYVNGNQQWAKIYDGMSGKLIAEWGAFGFKVK